MKSALLVLLAALAFFAPGSVAAQPQANRNLTICDFARNVYYLKDEDARQAWDFLAGKIDCAESSEQGARPEPLKNLPRPVSLHRYQIDLSHCLHVHCGAADLAADPETKDPESFFLHFSTPTTYRAPDGQLHTIPGCSGPPTKECRVKLFVWSDWRWVYNQKSPAFRAWMASRLLRSVGVGDGSTGDTVDSVFLDEHAPGFLAPFSLNADTFPAGGHIHEYGNRHYTEIDEAYNTDVSDSLRSYRTEFARHDKRLFVNMGNYVNSRPLQRMVLEQGKAAGGIFGEFINAPTRLDGIDQFETVRLAIAATTSEGGIYHLSGLSSYDHQRLPCDRLIEYADVGNYRTARERWAMWKLAAYYITKEKPGDPGKVAFHTDLCVPYRVGDGAPPVGGWLHFLSEWLGAYQVDLGVAGEAQYPERGPLRFEPTLCPGDRGQVKRGIFRRDFKRPDGRLATVYLRPRDAWNCTDFGDATRLPIRLDRPMRLLRGDGLAGPPLVDYYIRSGEALIVME